MSLRFSYQQFYMNLFLIYKVKFNILLNFAKILKLKLLLKFDLFIKVAICFHLATATAYFKVLNKKIDIEILNLLNIYSKLIQ